jgi:hypothetical protein
MLWTKVFKPVELTWAGAARSGARPLGRNASEKAGSSNF